MIALGPGWNEASSTRWMPWLGDVIAVASGWSSQRSVSEKMPVALTTTFARIRRSRPLSASRATTPQVWPSPPPALRISTTSM